MTGGSEEGRVWPQEAQGMSVNVITHRNVHTSDLSKGGVVKLETINLKTSLDALRNL